MAQFVPLDADLWRHRAAETRLLVEVVTDEKLRNQLLQIAADYDKLAERAEALERNQMED